VDQQIHLPEWLFTVRSPDCERQRTHFVMEDWHNFGADYDTTLMAWHERFQEPGRRLRTTIPNDLNGCLAII
jgi:cyclopropane fatty-acyl-phospholipid synthase-like methyltransferase